MDAQSIDIFKQARRIDPTLKISGKHHAELGRRRIHPVAFSRELLFSSMAAVTLLVPPLNTDTPDSSLFAIVLRRTPALALPSCTPGTSVYWINYGGSTTPTGAVMKLSPK